MTATGSTGGPSCKVPYITAIALDDIATVAVSGAGYTCSVALVGSTGANACTSGPIKDISGLATDTAGTSRIQKTSHTGSTLSSSGGTLEAVGHRYITPRCSTGPIDQVEVGGTASASRSRSTGFTIRDD